MTCKTQRLRFTPTHPRQKRPQAAIGRRDRDQHSRPEGELLDAEPDGREHQRRPVPQVPGVRHPADAHHRRAFEDRRFRWHPGIDPLAVLRQWDRRRARAWAQGDPEALATLYVPGSTAGERDLARLRRYVDRGLRELRRVSRRQVVLFFEPLHTHGFWGVDYFPESRALDQHISQLRKRIEKDAANPCIIRTVHGAGYRFE